MIRIDNPYCIPATTLWKDSLIVQASNWYASLSQPVIVIKSTSPALPKFPRVVIAKVDSYSVPDEAANMFMITAGICMTERINIIQLHHFRN